MNLVRLPRQTTGTISGSRTIYDNNGHTVDAHGHINKEWHPRGPTEIGGGVDYRGPRGKASIGLNHIRRPRQATGTLSGGGNIYRNGEHSVDGHGYVSKQWKPNGPTQIGGGLDYKGPRGGASVDVDHTRHFGTDVTARGNANLFTSRDGRTTVDGGAYYNRHFGGPFGTGRPNYGANIGLTHRF